MKGKTYKKVFNTRATRALRTGNRHEQKGGIFSLLFNNNEWCRYDS